MGSSGFLRLLDLSQLFNRLIEHLPGAAAVLDLRGGVAQAQLLISNHHWRELYPEALPVLWQRVPRRWRLMVLRGLKRQQYEFALPIQRDQQIINWVTVTLLNQPQEVLEQGLAVVHLDPTQHPNVKPIGHNLKPQRELNAIITTLPVLYVRSDRHGRVVACNEAYCQRRCVDTSELLNRTVESLGQRFRLAQLESSQLGSLLQDADQSLEDEFRYQEWLQAMDGNDILLRCLNADGRTSIEIWKARPIRDVQDRLLFCHWLGYDITQYLDLLSQQQVLHRELMHRVKNNLTTICSLVNLYRHSHPEAGSVLENIHQKIYAISLAQTHLDPRAVDRLLLIPYLQDLLAFLKSTPGETAAVRFEVSCDPGLAIHPTQAMPMALILQELLFAQGPSPGQASPLILTLSADGGWVAIALDRPENDGPSLLEQCPVQDQQIIAALTRQLQGQLQVTGSGAEATLRLEFPQQPTRSA